MMTFSEANDQPLEREFVILVPAGCD